MLIRNFVTALASAALLAALALATFVRVRGASDRTNSPNPRAFAPRSTARASINSRKP